MKEHVSCFAPWRTGGHFCLISVLHVSDPEQNGGGLLDWGGKAEQHCIRGWNVGKERGRAWLGLRKAEQQC